MLHPNHQSPDHHCTHSPPPPLHTSHVDPFVGLRRLHAALYSAALLAHFRLHSLRLLSSTTPLSFLLSIAIFVADLVLAFQWGLAQACRWCPVRRHEYPDRLLDAIGGSDGLPALDVFVCTADPYKEPPAVVVNTALSAMGFDYPAEKLSVYVSDDGGSELTLFAFMEAARFARYWLPFCRENRVLERSPESYFRSGGCCHSDNDKIKMLYQRMKSKVEDVAERGHVDDSLLISDEERNVFKQWHTTRFEPKEHPSVIQVLLESGKDMDIKGHPLPNLVYVSREKKKAFPHHFKAGALNALLRVSNVMTNAPMVLLLDCDTVSNDPESPLRALCYFLDSTMATNFAFVQFPQRFAGLNDGDTYNSELIRPYLITPLGMDSLRGPNYVGSGAFFSRRALSPPMSPISSLRSTDISLSLEDSLEESHLVMSSAFEDGTKWGSTVGFRYGSLVEDYYTGYQLHCEGWRSVFCNPDRMAFLGDVPTCLYDAVSQAKRWSVGLLEVAFSEHCPLTYGVKRASLLMGMCYAHTAFWPIWCIPIVTYGILPQIALVHQVSLFPKVSDIWLLLYFYLFLAAYSQDLVDFLQAGGSLWRWWNDQRMWMIRGVTSFPVALLEYLLNHLSFKDLHFNVTSKALDKEQDARYMKGVFDLGVASPYMVSVGMIATVNFTSFIIGLVRSIRGGNVGVVLVQLFISGFVVVNCWPIYEAMVVRVDNGRMPRKSVTKSFLLVGILHLLSYAMLKK